MKSFGGQTDQNQTVIQDVLPDPVCTERQLEQLTGQVHAKGTGGGRVDGQRITDTLCVGVDRHAEMAPQYSLSSKKTRQWISRLRSLEQTVLMQKAMSSSFSWTARRMVSSFMIVLSFRCQIDFV